MARLPAFDAALLKRDDRPGRRYRSYPTAPQFFCVRRGGAAHLRGSEQRRPPDSCLCRCAARVDPGDAVVEARDGARQRGPGFSVHVGGAGGGYLATLFRNPDSSMRGLDEVREDCTRFPLPEVHAEGIGCPQVGGFLFDMVDEVVEVPDTASIAAMRLLEEQLGRRYGGPSGTKLVGCLRLCARMGADGIESSIVGLLRDPRER